MQDENNYYTPPNESQPYGSPDYGQGYGSQYGQPNQPYGNPYGQMNQPYGYLSYDQQYQQGMGYGMDIAPFDQNGKPIPNRFAMKLTFSILEIIACNFVSIICGILGCIFTVKANTAYRERRWEDFKSSAKASAIALWIGFGFTILVAFLFLILVGLGLSESFDVGSGEPYVYVDGTRIDIPTNYDDMTDLGFYLSRSESDTMLAADDYALYEMYNIHQERVMWCWFYNTGDNARYVADCPIVGVNIDNYSCENYRTYRTQEGLGFQSSVQDFMNVYGVPDSVGETYYGIKYKWYLGDKDDPMWRVIEATFDGDQLYEIDVDYKK